MAKRKDFADFDFGGDGGDPTGGNINWDEIIGQQPENGSFIGANGTDVNGLSPEDYNQLFQQAGDGLDESGNFKFPGLGGNGGGSDLIRMLTGSSSGGLGSLLPFIASIFGGMQQRHATQDATHQIQDSLANANKQITDLLGGAQATYKPYMDAGLKGLAGLQAFPQSNLAANFSPIGSGRGLNLAQIVKGK